MSARPTFFARRAILILMVIFFLVPFALRGARMSVQGMKNDVKDWLPKDFPETADLDWFREHFISESFVVVSWDKCYGDATDSRYQLFLKKLEPELPPTQLAKLAAAKVAATTETAKEDEPASEDKSSAGDHFENPTKYFQREPFIGDDLGLYLVENGHENWGGQAEKWLRGRATTDPANNTEAWYYITPEGDLFRWNAVDAPVASLARMIGRAINGPSVEGELIASFGPQDGPWYHEEPRRLRAQLFKSVTTGPAVLESLTREGGELASDPDEAERRLSGSLLGPKATDNPDGPRQTCMLLTLTNAARQNLHLIVGRGLLGKPRGILYDIAKECNIAKDDSGEGLWLGGPPVDNVAIDEEGTITLVRLVGLCVILGIGLSLLCFRSISATIMVFFIGSISAVASIAFVWWLGSSMDAILMSMPALVYVLALSGAAHIINYYHDAVTDHGHAGAPERAIAHGWKPAMFCNVTTAIGLISLLTSELVPIQKFGLYSAIGVMVTLAITFTYLPAALQIWPQNRRPKPVEGQADGAWMSNYLNGFWQVMGGFIIRHNLAVAVGSVLVIAIFGYGVTYVKTSVNMLKMFNSQAKIIRDYENLESHLGPLMPMEIIVSIPKSAQRLPLAELAKLEKRSPEEQFQLSFIERMELAARVQQVIEEEFGAAGRNEVGCAMSAATFVRPLPGASGDTLSWANRNTTSTRLEAHRDDFLHSDYLRMDQQTAAELWRISLRIPATKGVDYGVLSEELKEAVEPVILAQRERDHILRAIATRQVEAEREKSELEKREYNPGAIKVSNAKILLLGMPASLAAKRSADSDGDEVANEVKKPLADVPTEPAQKQPIDQDRIFARSLRDLLKISRSRLAQHTPDDPQAKKMDWSKSLPGYDCVVLVGDHQTYDLAEIQKYAKVFVDVRESRFKLPEGTSADVAAMQTAFKKDPNQVGAVYTGVVPIVYKAQRELLNSLIQSTLWSFLTITPLMMFISRSVWGGLVSMLPNVLPVVMVFGGMGWLGIDVDVGSMMTASIALGVAVDDTIHYLNWFREELDRVGDRKLAILAAYKHCATPTFQAAILSGLGLSIFALSTFTPTQRFGYLMLAILWMGVAAELIFFPALLAGPLGAAFKPRKQKAASRPVHPEVAGATPEQLAEVAADVLRESVEEESDNTSGVPTPSKANFLRTLRQDRSHGKRKS